MKLKNIKNIPAQIASELVSFKDEKREKITNKIISLLYNDSADALESVAPKISLEELIDQNYIGFYPAVEVGINSIDKSTFLIINIENIDFYDSEGGIEVTGGIYVTTDKAYSLLKGNKLRLLELVDLIDSALDGEKIGAAGKITLTGANYVVFSDFRCGYRIDFRLADQQKRKAEL